MNQNPDAAPPARTPATLLPDDVHNRDLMAQVHPREWETPKPCGRHNLVVIGRGTAGLVSAMGAAGLGARVALVERNLLGGDCHNYGCVPSKVLIRSARRVAVGIKWRTIRAVRVEDQKHLHWTAPSRNCECPSPHRASCAPRQAQCPTYIGLAH